MNANSQNVGALIIGKQGNAPAANGAGTRNGAAIDRFLANGNTPCLSGVLLVNIGAATGSPSSFTVDVKLQDSDDGSTGWADYKPDGSNTAAIAQQTAGSVLVELDVSLAHAKRYVRVVEVIAISGGSTPTVPASETLVLGGSDRLPI